MCLHGKQKKKKKKLLFFVELDIPTSFKSNLFLIRRKIANFFFFVSNGKTNGIFSKKKLVSNDSELSNSARNGKKKFGRQMAGFGGSGCCTAAFFQFSVQAHTILRIKKKIGSLSLKMRLVWPENVNFRRKMAGFGGSGC